ncbi:hypothetical protein KY290_012067 [Solanum tuberosum]|uniref:ARID domain-containing protein n=1 Tax=Solanum tuberosum TaxID=4113 RepID=A0ABQ7W4M1_SOLTU|nr:hypothetical protein KY290_012067 [Solanum tuberosum]
MDEGDVEMRDAETNVPASDVLVSNESLVKYENGDKTGKNNSEDKTHEQTIEVMDYSIGKAPEPASLMFLINPSTANDGQHSGEASENISAMMVDGEDDEGSLEDQAAFIGKLGTFYREKAMEFKLPKFYGHPLNCLKLWRSVIRLGGYDRVTGFKLWRQVGDSFNPPK